MKTRTKIILGGALIGAVAAGLLVRANRSSPASVFGARIAGAQTVAIEPDRLTVADFPDIPGVTAEYVDAFRLFLKEQAGDGLHPGYAGAAAAFEKIAAAGANPEIRLRSLYMLTLCRFLDGRIDQACKSAREAAALSAQLHPSDERVVRLGRTITAIDNGVISAVGNLKTETGEPSAGFTDDLNSAVEARRAYDRLRAQSRVRRGAE